MSLVLDVDGDAWRAHLRSYVAAQPDVVPVVKGNGYGFGRERLLVEAADLGVDTVAIGRYAEAGAALDVPALKTVLVLEPWRPGSPAAGRLVSQAHRLLHTVSRVQDIAPLAEQWAADRPARVVVELLTTMRRHGVEPADLPALCAQLAGVPGVAVEGTAFHLPIDRPRGTNPLAEVRTLLARLAAAGVDAGTAYTSHLSASELSLAGELPGTQFRPRVGTALWLGAASALRARACVIDVHPVRRGDRSGYRQRRLPADGSLVVVRGGTAHGIGLDAAVAPRGLARARVLATAGLDAVGLRLSPFRWRGAQRWYAEPPHMQVSLLFVPATVVPPAVGDWLDVDCRKTTTTFDEVRLV